MNHVGLRSQDVGLRVKGANDSAEISHANITLLPGCRRRIYGSKFVFYVSHGVMSRVLHTDG